MSDDLKKMLEEERRRRLALTDRIARALAALDPDPDPGQIDGAVQYCRICRLLLERYRAAAALLEMDPQLLEEGGTVERGTGSPIRRGKARQDLRAQSDSRGDHSARHPRVEEVLGALLLVRRHLPRAVL